MKTPHHTPSVFDRLTKQDTAAQSTITENIRRNLSALLNTRRLPAPVSSDDLTPALTRYGVPEMSIVSVDDETARDAFMTMIAQQISIFEPRLRHISVFIPEKKRISPRRLELVIEAELYNSPEHKTLAFRSVLDLSSCFIQLEEPYVERISGTLS